jgi:hypothetical protein
MGLKQIVSDLQAQAKENETRAYKILGARPGPGYDLLIHPIEPLCGQWFVDGLTPAGVAFVKRFWEYQPLSSQKIAEMRKQATIWGLTFQTKYPVLSLTED